MMVDRWRGISGRANDGVAPGKGYRDFLSCFGIPVREFQLTYRRDGLIDDISVWGGRGEEIGWIHSPLLFIRRTILLHAFTTICATNTTLHRALTAPSERISLCSAC